MFDIRYINGKDPSCIATSNMEEQKKASELEDQLLEERLRCDDAVWGASCMVVGLSNKDKKV